MRITPDEDAEQFRATVRGFLRRYADTATVFREMAGDRGWDPAVWSRFAGEMGAVALDVPEEYGGAGASFREVAVAAEELGRSLVRLPWLSTAVLGVGVLLHASGADAEAARSELLPRLASGDATATLAYQEQPAEWDSDSVGTTAVADGDGWVLNGRKTMVIEGATADLVFVAARAEDGLGLFVVEADAAGFSRTMMRAMDPNRQLATVSLRDVRARAVGEPGTGAPTVGRVLDRAVAALAAEQTGGAEAALEMAVTYAGGRLQFGRAIGTFQAIKHRCADMAVQVEAARSASLWAAAAAAEAPEELWCAASAAALACGGAYSYVAGETIQVHGGIGFTWEHPAHLHFRRAATSAVLFGDRRVQQETLLASLDIESP